MRLVARFCLSVFVLLQLVGCGQKSAGLQESAVSPDQKLFENGMNFLEKNNFIKARLSFQTLINTYPDGEYAPSAFLAIADSYYEEGGRRISCKPNRLTRTSSSFIPPTRWPMTPK